MNGANIPGKTKAVVFYFCHFGRYRQQIKEIAETGFPGFLVR